jgi:hypothetical protein
MFNSRMDQVGAMPQVKQQNNCLAAEQRGWTPILAWMPPTCPVARLDSWLNWRSRKVGGPTVCTGQCSPKYMTWALCLRPRTFTSDSCPRMRGNATGSKRPLARVPLDESEGVVRGHFSWASQLAKIPISNNVGDVKPSFEHTTSCTRRTAPFRSRRWFALSNLGSL